MTREAKATRSPYYVMILNLALVGGVLLAPTPDFIVILLMVLATVSVALVLGFIIWRGIRHAITSRVKAMSAGIAVGLIGNLLCHLGLRLLPSLHFAG